MPKIFLFAILLFSISTRAQQDPTSSMYWNNYAHFNPATSGISHGHEFNGTFRSQWRNVEGAPNTAFMNYNTIIADHHGAGINYFYDEIGFTKNHRASLNYNYQFKFNNSSKLALGIAPGFSSLSTHINWPSGPQICYAGPIPPNNSTLNNFMLNAGVAFKSPHFYTGVSTTNIFRLVQYKTEAWVVQPVAHYYAHFEYKHSLRRNWDISYGALYRTDGSFNSLQLHARTYFLSKKKLSLGLGFRHSDGFIVNSSYTIKSRYKIGYSYDYTTSKLNKGSNGSHEFALSWIIP